MSDPFIGEIRMFGGNFAPVGWAFCDGQLMSIAEYDTLFSLIGTTYGGDGQSTFALPDLRGRAPLHRSGSTYPVGAAAGAETVTLTLQQLPAHNHLVQATNTAPNASTPQNNVLAASTSPDYLGPGNPALALAPACVGLTGSTMPHENMQPFQCVSFIIALFGIYPSFN